MPEKDYAELTFEKGLCTASDRLRMKEGTVELLRNWYYRLGDQTRVWKMKGRQEAGSLGTSTGVKGLKHIQYEDETDVLVAHANTRLYESSAGLSGLTFSTAQDADGNDFTPDGDYLRVAHDGNNQWWCIVGENDRPLVRDYDGNWRRAGLVGPKEIPSLSLVSSTPTLIRPNASSGTGFDDPDRAYDDDDETAAHGQSEVGSWKTTDWTFASGTDASNFYINIDLEGDMNSRQPPDKALDLNPELGGSVYTHVKVEISEDGGTSFTTIYDAILTTRRTLQHQLGSSVDSGDIVVRVSHTKAVDGLSHLPVTCYVYEIWAGSGGDSSNPIEPGTYGYAVSEVYRRQLSNGQTIEVESLPTKVKTITVPSSPSYYGIEITLPDRQNQASDGYSSTYLFRRIYRTTSTGTWPDLGMIGECPITATTYLDDFQTVDYDSLGQPPLPVVNAGDAWYNACGVPPSLIDVCFYRGALVGISAVDNRRIYWSLPGFAEYWPTEIHTMRLLPTERQDRLKAIISLGDVMLLFSRNQVFRVRGLPFASRPNFDLSQTDITVLSPAIGLAGTPSAVCLAHAFDGYPLVFWVADNGIWMTDGGLPSERGTGVMKVSLALDWEEDVDTDRLDETVLAYDTADQILRFQYYDPDGNRREVWFHVAPEHWVQLSPASKPVPKASGPHPVSDNSKRLVDLAAGEHSAIFRLWSLSSEGKVYVEMYGTGDGAQFAGLGGDIVSVLETGWIYPAGPLEYAEVVRGACYHNDWGSHTLMLELQGRNDSSGTSQHLVQSAIPLTGERLSTFEAAGSGGGQSMKFRLTHTGQATGAIGALVLKIRPGGTVEG